MDGISRRQPVVIEVALNGGRDRSEHPTVPLTPANVILDAAGCFEAGATVAHIHARTLDGTASFDPAWYAEAIQGIRAAAPGMAVSITSLRPAGLAAETVTDLLRALAERSALPELISVNLGHTVLWDRTNRRTVHYPNDFDDVVCVLEVCAELKVAPELGVMDLGYISNAVLLRDEGYVRPDPWFLLELDSPGYGQGMQVAPATPDNYDYVSATLRQCFPAARWAAHGNGAATYPVLERALQHGAHVRVGLEDTVVLPDGSPGDGNLDQVHWAVQAAKDAGRAPASPSEMRRIVGLSAA